MAREFGAQWLTQLDRHVTDRNILLAGGIEDKAFRK
jgi:hypothetical protein